MGMCPLLKLAFGSRKKSHGDQWAKDCPDRLFGARFTMAGVREAVTLWLDKERALRKIQDL